MSILKILDTYNVDYKTQGHPHCTIGYANVDCPKCSPDWKHYRLGFNLDKYFAHCWSCGGINLLTALHELTGENYPKLRELLGDYHRYFIEEKPRGKLVLPKGIEPLLPAHRSYLIERGFDPDELANLWGVKAIGLHPTLSWRLFIPITLRGKLVSWTTRSLRNTGIRYLSASSEEESVPHKSILYGEDLCTGAVLIVEGTTDVWRVGPGAVCTFGTGFTQAQLERMSRFPVRIVAYDSERQAQRKARELCKALNVYPGETLNVVLESKDPGECSNKEIKELRKLIGA